MSKRHDYQRPLSQERSETAKNFRNQKNYHSNTDSELLDILMEQDIQYLTKLAKQYYGT
jgi:chemotaxis regulatin CheY-phosphate phosphatase CheZ